MAKVCITGVCGHIGSRLVRELLAKNTGEVIGIDNMAEKRYCSLFGILGHPRFTFIEKNYTEVDYAAINPDCVVHLAASTDAVVSQDNPELYLENNYYGVRTLVDKLNQLEVKPMLIFPSTTSVYGVAEPGTIVDELHDDHVNPQSTYAEAKRNSEKYIWSYYRSRHLLLRLGTIIGPSEGMRFHTAVNKFCWSAVTGVPVPVWTGALGTKRPYLFLEDFINFIVPIILGTKSIVWDKTPYNFISGNFFLEEILLAVEIEANSRGKRSYTVEVENKLLNQLSYEVSTKRISPFLDPAVFANPSERLAENISKTFDKLLQ